MALCEEHIRLSNEVAAVTTRVDGLEEYRDRQNGALQRLDEKFDRLLWGLLALTATTSSSRYRYGGEPIGTTEGHRRGLGPWAWRTRCRRR